MAELNLNFDPAWLQSPDSSQPMSLAQAFQIRQQQQQIDVQKALLPLRQQELQANLANAALDMKIKQEQTDLALKLKANDAAGWERASRVTDWSDPSQVAPIFEQGGKGGGFSPGFTTFIENMQQNAQMFSAKEAATAARIETMQDALRSRETIAELGARTRIDVAESQAQAAKERLDAAIASREEIAKSNNQAKADIEVLRSERILKNTEKQIEAKIKMLDTQIESREKVAGMNNTARAAVEKLKQERMLLDKSRQVSWPEFLNRHLEGYVRATAATPADAAKALRKLYDDHIAIKSGPGSGNPKDPLDLFTP